MKNAKYHLCICLALMSFLLPSCEECGINEIGNNPLPGAFVGVNYGVVVDIDTRCHPLLEYFVLEGGSLPPGLALSKDGEIHGTPSRAGEYYFTVSGEVCYSEDLFGYFDCYEQAKGLLIRVDE